MDEQRRNALKAGAGLGVLAMLVAAGVVAPAMAQAAASRRPFEAKTLEEAFLALGAGEPADSAAIEINAPEVAENGTLVPIGVVSRLPGTEQLTLLVDRNRLAVAANFEFPDGTLPELQTRIKMAQTSNVYALVRAEGKFHIVRREVRVTLGGCG